MSEDCSLDDLERSMCSIKDDIFKLYQKFKDINTVVSILRRSGTRISVKRAKEIIISKYLEIAEQIKDDIAKGMSIDDLVKKYNASPRMMQAVLERMGIRELFSEKKPQHDEMVNYIKKFLESVGLKVISTRGYVPDLIIISGNKIIALEYENKPPSRVENIIKDKITRAKEQGYDDVVIVTWGEVLSLDKEVKKIKEIIESQK